MADVNVKFKGDASDLKREIDSVEAESESAGAGIGEGLVAGLKAHPVGAAFAAVGAAAGAAFLEGVSQEATADKIGAGLTLTPEESEQLGDIAAESYMQGFGESVEANTEAAAGAIRSGLIDIQTMTEEEAAGINSQLLGLADTTGLGVEEIAQAAGSALRSGLASDSQEALDLLASLGGSVNMDEAIAATQEYSPFLEDLGLGAEEWGRAMQSGEQTSIQSIDKTGDALKEFGIIMNEESDAAREALEGIGLDADDMFRRVQEGDPTALEDIVDALAEVEDEGARARAGIALMGTPFEDLGDSALPIMQDLVSGQGDLVSAQENMTQAYDNAAGKFTENWRRIKQGAIDAIAENVLPLVNEVMDFFIDTVPGALQTLQEWWSSVFGGIGSDTEGTFGKVQEIISGVMEIVQEVVSQVTEAIQALWEAWGDEILIIAEHVWNSVKNVIDTVLGVIQGIIDVVMGILTGDWERAWEGIKGIVTSIWDGIKGVVENTINTVLALIGGTLESIQETWDRIWGNISGFVSDTWSDIVGFVQGGIEDAWGFVEDVGGNILGWFEELPGKIGGFFAGLADTIASPFRAGIDAIKSAWNNTIGGVGFTVPDWVRFVPGGGGIAGKRFAIPTLHEGGVFRAPMGQREGLALLEDEEIVVNPRSGRVASAGSGEMHLHLHLPYGFVGSERQLAAEIDRILAKGNRSATLSFATP